MLVELVSVLGLDPVNPFSVSFGRWRWSDGFQKGLWILMTGGRRNELIAKSNSLNNNNDDDNI